MKPVQPDLFAPQVTLKEALAEMRARQWPDHKKCYKPLPPEMSDLVRTHFAETCPLPPHGNNETRFRTPNGNLIATGYSRVVVGDYGAYIEFSEDQIVMAAIRNKFGGLPDRPVKYVWMEPLDGSSVKVYRQVNTVQYADYLPGRYYISPDEIRWD